MRYPDFQADFPALDTEILPAWLVHGPSALPCDLPGLAKALDMIVAALSERAEYYDECDEELESTCREIDFLIEMEKEICRRMARTRAASIRDCLLKHRALRQVDSDGTTREFNSTEDDQDCEIVGLFMSLGADLEALAGGSDTLALAA